MCGPNFEILTSSGGDLSREQAQKKHKTRQIWILKATFYLEGQGWSLHKTIGTLTNLFCNFVPNLVILAWTGPELSHGQATDWHRLTHTRTHTHTHTHTDACNDNTRRPKLASGKNALCPTSTKHHAMPKFRGCPRKSKLTTPCNFVSYLIW